MRLLESQVDALKVRARLPRVKVAREQGKNGRSTDAYQTPR